MVTASKVLRRPMRRSWFIAAVGLAIGAVAIVVLVVRLTEDGIRRPRGPSGPTRSVRAFPAGARRSQSLADMSGGGTLTPNHPPGEARRGAGRPTLRSSSFSSGNSARPRSRTATRSSRRSTTRPRGSSRATNPWQSAASDAAAAEDQDDSSVRSRCSATTSRHSSRTCRTRWRRPIGVALRGGFAELEQAFADAVSCQQLRAES